MCAKTKITMQTIADELGLSRYTISAVLNDRAERCAIPQETIQRVKKYVAQRGYHQNIGALSMRGKYSKDLGILAIGSGGYPAHDQIIKALENYTAGKKITPVTFSLHNSDFEKLSEVAQQIKIYNIRKVIIFATNFERNALLTFLGNLRQILPETLIYVYGNGDISDALAEDKNIFSAYHDPIGRHKLIADIAENNGYERIILHRNPGIMQDFFSKMEIFELTKLSIDVPKPPDYVIIHKFKMDHGIAIAEQLKSYDFKKKKTLVFINDDYMSIAFVCRMQKYGFRIPEDFGLISLDNLPVTEQLNISSIGNDYKKVIDAMIQWIETGKAQHQHEKIPEIMNNARSF